MHEPHGAEQVVTAFLGRSVFSVGIRGFVKCDHCASQIPANHMGDTARCHRCGKDTPTEATYWKRAIYWNCVAAVMTGRATTYELDDYTIRADYPVCASCKSSVPQEIVEQAVGSTGLVCPKCDQPIPCRPANDVARAVVPGAVLLVGEAEYGSRDAGPLRSSKPVVLACMHCGGTLAADGSKRLVACSYCQADNYLPDEVWLALHPQPVAQDFYVVAQPPLPRIPTLTKRRSASSR